MVMTTQEQHFFFLVLVKLVDKNHMIILLDEQNLTDINVHIIPLQTDRLEVLLLELLLWITLDHLESYSSKCNLCLVSVQYALMASLMFFLPYPIFVCIKGHEGNRAYSFGTVSAVCFSYAFCNSIEEPQYRD